MILLDSSAWIGHFRKPLAPENAEVRRILQTRYDDIAICDPVAMELLAGALPDAVDRTEQLIAGLPTLPLETRLDFRSAAALYRAARAQGETVRSMVDCLIAAVALRHGARVVHRDRDYAVLAGVSGLDHLDLH